MRRVDFGKIHLKRRAPAIEPKRERDALIDDCSPFTVTPTRHVMRLFKATDSINLLRIYLALASHANKAGMLHCGQERIATVLGLSRKTVTRSIKVLRERGLLGLEYRRPVGPNRFLLVLRVIYDKGATRQDAISIASPLMGQQRVPSVNPINGADNITEGTSPIITEGTTVSPFTEGTSSVSLQAHEHKTPLPPLLKNAESVLAHWQACAMIHDLPNIIANEADLAIAHRLVASGITASQLEDAIVDNPGARLEPIVRSLLP